MEFNLDGLTLSSGSTSYTMQDMGGNLIKMTKNVVAVNNFIFSGIVTPWLSPSQPISVSTYSSTDYLMSEATTFVWTTTCDHVCR